MAEATHAQQQRQVRWEAGDKAEFFSLTHRRWVSCHVVKADAESGAVMINVKPNAWLEEAHTSRLRTVHAAAGPQTSKGPAWDQLAVPHPSITTCNIVFVARVVADALVDVHTMQCL